MAAQKRLFEWEVRSGEKVRRGNITVTPQSRVLVLHWPNIGGLVWNRPAGVRVEKDGQVVDHISIIDVTKLAQYTLFGFSALMIVIGFLLSIRQKRRNTS